MARFSLKLKQKIPLFMIAFLYVFLRTAESQADHTAYHLMTDAEDWTLMTSSAYTGGEEVEGEDDDDDEIERRSLYHRRPIHHYYISYGALSANRIPCPARSGRSYYTHNCFKARGPVHPYSRGCSRITRCRR